MSATPEFARPTDKVESLHGARGSERRPILEARLTQFDMRLFAELRILKWMIACVLVLSYAIFLKLFLE